MAEHAVQIAPKWRLHCPCGATMVLVNGQHVCPVMQREIERLMEDHTRRAAARATHG